MAHLKYYQIEQIEFASEFAKYVPSPRDQSIYLVVKKLYKHFKLGYPNLEITSGNRYSRCGSTRIVINRDSANYGTIAHEVAHALDLKKNGHGGRWHDKKHKRQMKIILNYLKRKNYFEEEIIRRVTPKPPKPEPTKVEVRDNKIELAQQKVLRYEKIVRMYTKKLQKSRKSLNMLKLYKKKSLV